MHVYFSGIGGTGIGPLALIAHQAGFQVSGSDKQHSDYIDYLKKQGVDDIHIGQDGSQIAAVNSKSPVDWFVYSSALPKENPNHPELVFCKENNIKTTKRDDFINELLKQKNLKMIAVAGTHGKTTTTAMTIWLFKQLGVPVSYSVGAKIPFGEMGEYEDGSEYFVYEADEYDRNFLAFHPTLSMITGVSWDHADIYPTEAEYQDAFRQFLSQSKLAYIWEPDANRLGVKNSEKVGVIDFRDYEHMVRLKGQVNRQDGALVAQSVMTLLAEDDITKLANQINKFPGLSRRFEKLAPGLYTDYAHTPEKIAGAIQTAQEVLSLESKASGLVVVYEGLHNTRQHFVKDKLPHMFDDAKHVYIVPSYLAREDKDLEMLTPDKLVNMLSKPELGTPSHLDGALKENIQQHLESGDLVLCLSAGGGGSLDEWLRQEF